MLEDMTQDFPYNLILLYLEPGNWLLNQLRIARLPGFVVEGFQRAIETENGVPALTENRLDPVALHAFGGLWTEIDVILHLFTKS